MLLTHLSTGLHLHHPRPHRSGGSTVVLGHSDDDTHPLSLTLKLTMLRCCHLLRSSCMGVAGGSRSSVIALRSDGTAADLGLKREFFEFRTSNFEIFPSLPPLPPEPLAPCLGSSGDAAAPDSPAEPSVPTASGGGWKGFNGWRKPGLPPGVLPPHSAVQGSRLSGPSQGRHATGPTLPPPALSTGLHLHPPRPHRSGGSTVGL